MQYNKPYSFEKYERGKEQDKIIKNLNKKVPNY